MLSYDKKCDGHQIAKKAGAENVDCGWADQVGSAPQESEYHSGGGTCNLFAS